MRNNVQHFAIFSPSVSKTLQWHFSLIITSVKETFLFGVLQAAPEIRSEENDRDCKRQTFKSQGRRMYCEAE